MYRNNLQDFGPIASLEEFAQFPLTTKNDLRDSYPYANLAVDSKEVIEVHTTSGTTGKPTVSFLTKKDIELTKKYISKAWRNFGINEESKVQFIMSYGLFSGAALNTYAIQDLGALVIPSGIQPTEKQVEIIKDFGVDTIVATPSYYLWLYDYLKKNDIDPSELGLKVGIAAGEVYSDELKQRIGDLLKIRVYDHYGLCEVNTGIIYECSVCGNMAVIKDYIYAEVVHPETNDPMPLGEYGELVLTATMKEASPILRYKTGDSVAILNRSSTCEGCFGSTLVTRVKGRLDDTVFYKGLLISPHEIRDFIVLKIHPLTIGGIKVQISTGEDDIIHEIRVVISISSGKVGDDFISSLEHSLYTQSKVHIKIELVDQSYFGDQTAAKSKLVEYVTR